MPAEDGVVDGGHLLVVELVDGDGVEVSQEARCDWVATAARWTHRRHQLDVGQVDRRRLLQVVPVVANSHRPTHDATQLDRRVVSRRAITYTNHRRLDYPRRRPLPLADARIELSVASVPDRYLNAPMVLLHRVKMVIFDPVTPVTTSVVCAFCCDKRSAFIRHTGILKASPISQIRLQRTDRENFLYIVRILVRFDSVISEFTT